MNAIARDCAAGIEDGRHRRPARQHVGRSVPLALDVAVRDGRIRRGDTVLLQGVGGGFTWGAVLLRVVRT